MDIGSQVLFNIGPVPGIKYNNNYFIVGHFPCCICNRLRKKLALIPGKMQGILSLCMILS